MRMLKCFFKKKIALRKLKKPPSKVAQTNSNLLFFPYCLSCPSCPNRIIHAMWPIDQLYIELGCTPFKFQAHKCCC